MTPVGNSAPETWEALVSGKSGIAPITAFDASKFKTQFAGEVKNFDPSSLIDRKEARKMDRYSQFSVWVANEALVDSGMDLEQEDRSRVGVIWGSGVGGLQSTEEEIIEALKAADAWSFISVLPDTYRSVVGEKGHNFSEGQLQRISIARAILRDAPILVMDEATSALDIDTEARVLRNVMTRNPNRICLITTHRASMLEYSDVIFRVDGDGCFQRLNSAADLKVSDLQPVGDPDEVKA